MPIAITPDQLALAASIRDWAKQAGPVAAVRRLESNPAEPAQNAYLTDLADLGIFSIPVPAEAGGAGGTVTDLAAALEQLTVALVPGPVTPTALAGLLLTAAGSPLLPAVTAGRATGAVALTAGTLTGTRAAGGTLHVTGQAGPVLGAGTTSHLFLGCTTDEGEAWFWIEAGCPGLTVTSRRPVDCVLGAPGEGWRVAMSTLATERVAIGGVQDEVVDKLLAAVTPDYAERAGFHVACAHAVALLGERGAHPAIRKLLGTAHRQAAAETALEQLGPAGAAETDASQEFLLTRCLSIAGGTTQILLTQVAERVLGLPR